MTDHYPRFGHLTDYEWHLVDERLHNLKQAYVKFKKLKDSTLGDGESCGFHMNRGELVKVPFLYVNDLKEFKTFHDADGGTDNFKRAAYLARHISNVRPIHVPDKLDVSKDLLTINEQFALFVFLSFLDVEEKCLKQEYRKKVISDLLYVFQFRDPQRELLVAVARTIGT